MQAKANKLLAKAIFASGSQLSMVEHRFWKDFFLFIRPSYALALPTTKTLSTTLLDYHYEEVKSDGEMAIAESGHLALQLDGWSNIISEGMINFVVTIDEQKPVYNKSLESKENRHTSEYATEIVNVINQYNPNKCIAIITDNAANMKKAAASISEAYLHISSIGCLAQPMHLIIMD